MSDVALLLLGVALIAGLVGVIWWLWREDAMSGTTIGSAQAAAATTDADSSPERVLFVCTHNAARSQMAEALLRHAAGDRFLTASAGTIPTGVHPLAEQVIAEIGLSLRSQRAKGLEEVGTGWDHAITLCDVVSRAVRRVSRKDLASPLEYRRPGRAPSEQRLEAFRRVRDDLARRITRWVTEQAEKL